MSNLEFDAYGQPKNEKNLPVVRFYYRDPPKLDKAGSKKAGHPVYRNQEMVEIRYPADRQRTIVRFADSEWIKVNGEKVTYKQRFPEQYARFKAGQEQVVEGTPLKVLAFLTLADQAMLRAQNVFTAEQLASLSGQALKNIGPNGLTMQQSAKRYLESASSGANTAAMQEELANLRKEMADLLAQGADPRVRYAEMSDDKIKEHIEEKTGQKPRGNPNRATLIRMAIEIEAGVPADAPVEEAA